MSNTFLPLFFASGAIGSARTRLTRLSSRCGNRAIAIPSSIVRGARLRRGQCCDIRNYCMRFRPSSLRLLGCCLCDSTWRRRDGRAGSLAPTGAIGRRTSPWRSTTVQGRAAAAHPCHEDAPRPAMRRLPATRPPTPAGCDRTTSSAEPAVRPDAAAVEECYRLHAKRRLPPVSIASCATPA